jgi:Caspase domain
MAGRALVFGAVVGDIRGIENDVAAFSALLAKRGFAVTTLDPRTAATRAAILAGYQELIDDVVPGTDEPVVIYFAGHGGMVFNISGHLALPLPSQFPCIIPIDYPDGSPTDFRGITSFELSALQARLTAKTHNVTTIYDCCHSGQMSKEMRSIAFADGKKPRTLEAPVPVAMRRHLDELHARYPEMVSQPALDNRHAVRVMACAQHETAWPVRDAQGQWYGALTRALLDVLDEVGSAPVTWATVGKAVWARVQRDYPVQNPRIEGPQQRVIFSLDELPTVATSLKRAGAVFALGTGCIAGVTVGDVYAVAPCKAPGSEIAQLRVTSVTPFGATAELVPGSVAADAIPADAIAVPSESTRPRRPLRVSTGSPDLGSRIQSGLTSTRRLRRATGMDDFAVAELVASDDGVRLFDATGPLLPMLSLRELPQALEVADHLAAARDLLELEGAHGVSPDELVIAWGVVENGRGFEQPWDGTVIGLDARIFLRIKNVGKRALFVHVFNIGVQGRISMLSSAAVTGQHLAPRQQIVFGNSPDDDNLVGLDLEWPSAMPRCTARLDTLLVLATTVQIDLRMLETPSDERSAQSRSRRAWKKDRSAPVEPAPITRDPYLMTSITYLIDPQLRFPWMPPPAPCGLSR